MTVIFGADARVRSTATSACRPAIALGVDYERAHKAHTTSVRGWRSLPIRTKRT